MDSIKSHRYLLGGLLLSIFPKILVSSRWYCRKINDAEFVASLIEFGEVNQSGMNRHARNINALRAVRISSRYSFKIASVALASNFIYRRFSLTNKSNLC